MNRKWTLIDRYTGWVLCQIGYKFRLSPCDASPFLDSWAFAEATGFDGGPAPQEAFGLSAQRTMPPRRTRLARPHLSALWVPFHMHKKLLLSLSSALIMVTAAHQAQAQSTPAAAAAAVPAPSPAKKELIARLIKLQQPGIEAMSTDMAQEPALQMLERAAAVLQARVAPEKREAVIKGVQDDAKKYMDKTMPLVSSRAVALAPDTVGPVLNQRFTEDELKKVIAILESPEYSKFQKMSGEMQQALQAKLVSDTRTGVEANLKTLEADLTTRLNAAVTPLPAAAAPSSPAADKAAKPAATK